MSKCWHTNTSYTLCTHWQVHKRVMVCKQGTNPDNFAHKVELNFSLQSKLSFLGQHLAFTKAHCSYHLKCERTALSHCFFINNVDSQEKHHNSIYLLWKRCNLWCWISPSVSLAKTGWTLVLHIFTQLSPHWFLSTFIWLSHSCAVPRWDWRVGGRSGSLKVREAGLVTKTANSSNPQKYWWITAGWENECRSG